MASNNSRDQGPENALTSAFSAARGERLIFRGEGPDDALAVEAEDREFLDDISRIPVNARQMTLAALSPRWQDADEAMAQRHRRDKESADRRETLERLAAWDAQKVIVGGVEMTNAEAQAARSHVCRDADAYAKWAVRRGLIRSGEEEEFKHAARRMYELKEAERKNGKLSEDQTREWEALSRSRVGRAVEETVAAAHLDKGARIEATGAEASSHAAAEVDDPVFPTAPPVNSLFAKASTGVPAPETAPEQQAPLPTAKPDARAQPGF